MKTRRVIFVLLLSIVILKIFGIALDHLSGIYLFAFRLILSLIISFALYKLFEHKIQQWLLRNFDNQVTDIIEIDESKEFDDTQKLKLVSREMKKHIYDLHNLFEVSTNLTSILDYDKLINSLLLSLIGQLKVTTAVILFPTEENWRILRPVYSKGISKSKLSKLEFYYDDSLINYFQSKTIPVNLRMLRKEDIRNESWHQFLKAGTTLLAPITHQRKVIGIIALGNKITNTPFTQSEIEIFSLMTNIASVAISNAKLYQQMEMISITDELTGLYNYRFFKKQLNDELARAKRFRHFLSLIILDVDNFKNYNDALGHPAGDEALRQIGKLLKKTARQSDIVSRYGGEEFCAILPEVDMQGASHFSERLRKQIESHSFFEEHVQPSGKLTISVGVASFPDDASKMDELFKNADTALYRAKHHGRNRVCLFSKV